MEKATDESKDHAGVEVDVSAIIYEGNGGKQKGTDSRASVSASNDTVLPESDEVGAQNPIQKERKGSNCSVSDVPCKSGADDISVMSATVCEVRQSSSGCEVTTTSQEGCWVPVPGHPRVKKWMPAKTSQPRTNTSRHVKKGCCKACDKRCSRWWHSAVFGVCCIPFMVCLLCCGPPGWFVIYIIISERRRQEMEDRED